MRFEVQAPREDLSTCVVFGEHPLSIDEVVALARGEARPHLASGVRARMQRSRDVLERLLELEAPVYGVTTSVGAAVGTVVPPAHAEALQLNVLRMHGCGTGRLLSDEEAAAVLVVRLCSLAAGHSGVRPIVAERLATLLDKRALPLIPAEGSVGASGDLTPLSYVAAVLVGEREVSFDGRQLPAAAALEQIGCEPLKLQAKEALALMNGTAVGSAIGCLAWYGARRLARLSAALTSMALSAVRGNPVHFDALLHGLKPHPGQKQVARWIRDDLGQPARPARGDAARLQERYSLRCVPQITGVLVDALAWTRQGLEIEINGVSDNPVVDVEREVVLHGGNFYGGHLGFFFDALKIAVANLACLFDRQLMLLCNPAESDGLPADLVGVSGAERCAHNGFKAMTIAASALAAEALKLTVPASAFSRSTELHNQDKVPMATLAARDLQRVVELTEQVGAILTLACCQALELRAERSLVPRGAAMLRAIRARVPRLEHDRRMDGDIHAVLELLRGDRLPVGDVSLS